MLKLPVSTTIVAINIAQYYFTRKSFLDYDFRDVAMGSMFLACKSEETLRRSYQIAAVFDYIFKVTLFLFHRCMKVWGPYGNCNSTLTNTITWNRKSSKHKIKYFSNSVLKSLSSLIFLIDTSVDSLRFLISIKSVIQSFSILGLF